MAASTWMLRLCRVAMAVEGGVAKGRGWASSVTSVCIARGSSSNCRHASGQESIRDFLSWLPMRVWALG
ncbi:hypothetical protein D3C86_1848190 [compost metagenome]